MVAAASSRLRTSSRRAGGAGAVTVALGAVFLAVTAYLTLREAVIPGGGPAEPPSVEALRKLSPGELDDAFRAAQRAYAHDPLDAEALIALSRLAEARGDAEAAARLKLMAGELQPRATAVQAEALAILLARRDFDGAMTRLDGLIRARPQQAGVLFDLAAEIARDTEGRNAVARKLAARPPWRPSFLAHTVARGNPGTAQRIIAELRALGTPADADELALLIERYMRDGAVDKAYATWLSSLSPAELQQVRLVYDGGFSQAVRNLRFDWTVTPAKGLSHRMFPRNTASMDQSLQLDFQGVEGSFANLSQVLRLKPGRYRLTGEARFDGFQSPSGVVFRLHCMKAGQLAPLDETAPLPQSSQWMAFERGFTVPAADCPDQLLRLESRSPTEGGQFTRGQIALDNLAVDKLPELAP
jgi:tetratricopeptide (TPR) repeat protein